VKYNNHESVFYEILKEQDGRFRFTPGIPSEDMMLCGHIQKAEARIVSSLRLKKLQLVSIWYSLPGMIHTETLFFRYMNIFAT